MRRDLAVSDVAPAPGFVKAVIRAIDKYNATQYAPIINTRSTIALRKEVLKPSHLLVRQPKNRSRQIN